MNPIYRLLYSPLHAQLVLTRRCNLSCGYCSESDPAAPLVPLAQLEQRVDRLRALGTFTLGLTGGEPLLHPGVFRLVRHAKRAVSRVSMLTNGFLLTRDAIQELNEAGLDALQISLDGVVPNETTRKVLALLEHKLILLRQHARFRVTTNTVTGVASSDEVLEVVRTTKTLGFAATVGVLHDASGQVALDGASRRAYVEADRLRRRPVWEIPSSERDLIRNGNSPFRCRAGSRYLYVDEVGDVHWCAQQRGVFRKPLDDYTSDDLRAQFYKTKGCSVQCTLGCARRASSLDGWRRQGARRPAQQSGHPRPRNAEGP